MKEIKTVGIIGFGVMGAAIGINAAMSGYRVVFKELNDELVQTMFDKWVVKSLEKRVAKGKISQADMDAITGMISGTSRYEALSECDLIIEAAIEKILEGHRVTDALCAGNTSAEGRFRVLLVSVEVDTFEDMEKLDEALRGVEGVKMVL